MLDSCLSRRISEELVELVDGVRQLGEDVDDVLVQFLAGVAFHRRVEHRSVPFVQNLGNAKIQLFKTFSVKEW